MYRRLGPALGVGPRGNRLADAADALLAKYRGALSTGAPVRVYLACSADGFQPCLADQSAGEQLSWLGGVNVAGTRESAPRRPLSLDEIKNLTPQVIVINGPPGVSARLRAESGVALDRSGCGRARLRVASPAVFLGCPTSFREPAPWTGLARLRLSRAPVRPRVRERYQGLLPRFLSSRAQRRAVAAASPAVAPIDLARRNRVIDRVDDAIERFDGASPDIAVDTGRPAIPTELHLRYSHSCFPRLRRLLPRFASCCVRHHRSLFPCDSAASGQRSLTDAACRVPDDPSTGRHVHARRDRLCARKGPGCSRRGRVGRHA